MIRDVIHDDIYIVIFTASLLNDHDEQIYTLIGPVSTSSAKRGQRIFVEERNQKVALTYILLYP
jgi:hypothetical protein